MVGSAFPRLNGGDAAWVPGPAASWSQYHAWGSSHECRFRQGEDDKNRPDGPRWAGAYHQSSPHAGPPWHNLSTLHIRPLAKPTFQATRPSAGLGLDYGSACTSIASSATERRAAARK